MTYVEYILIYLTLISGLAFANVLRGLSIIITRWSEIKVSSEYLVSTFLLSVTISDYWFNSFAFPYEIARHNILFFMIFLIPSALLFFHTVILFPRPGQRIYDYTTFFQKNLRSNIFSYGLFIFFLLIKLFIADFMFSMLAVPLFLVLCGCIIIYITNSIKVYIILITILILLNILRWGFQSNLYNVMN